LPVQIGRIGGSRRAGPDLRLHRLDQREPSSIPLRQWGQSLTQPVADRHPPLLRPDIGAKASIRAPAA
jgi:hypothetical protein